MGNIFGNTGLDPPISVPFSSYEYTSDEHAADPNLQHLVDSSKAEEIESDYKWAKKCHWYLDKYNISHNNHEVFKRDETSIEYVFSMLLLVLSGNFLVMFFGWELVGLSSYLLISFWSEKKSAARAGNKAFILNRIGDFGFLIGLMMILNEFQTFNFLSIFESTLETTPENLDVKLYFYF